MFVPVPTITSMRPSPLRSTSAGDDQTTCPGTNRGHPGPAVTVAVAVVGSDDGSGTDHAAAPRAVVGGPVDGLARAADGHGDARGVGREDVEYPVTVEVDERGRGLHRAGAGGELEE